jgi:uncharacterized protein
VKALFDIAERLIAEGERPAPPCADPVNLPLIRAWTQALGDVHPSYLKDLAPPAMIQVWSMPGLGGPKTGSVADEPLKLLNDSGFTGVVATNCEQVYDRYLRHGEELRSTMRLGSVTGPKKTALGEGYFVTWYQTWYVGDERVAEMLFRVLKFKPRTRPARYPLRPTVGQDTAFFWDGVNAGELRIQRCADCGALRHPPGPMCPHCHSVRRDHIVASGRGELHSFVVHHHPPVPGKEPPFVVALIDLPEGVRMLGNLLGCPVEEVRIGMPVEVAFERMDDELTLPQWKPLVANDSVGSKAQTADSSSAGAGSVGEGPSALPSLEIALTPTFVISTALATRDFTPVHHDTELARAQGSKDIFLNILTTMGLVERFVTDWAPDANLAAISVRLGVPAYAGDTLVFSGRMLDETTIEVRGAVSLGDHVTGLVRLKEAL